MAAALQLTGAIGSRFGGQCAAACWCCHSARCPGQCDAAADTPAAAGACKRATMAQQKQQQVSGEAYADAGWSQANQNLLTNTCKVQASMVATMHRCCGNRYTVVPANVPVSEYGAELDLQCNAD
jgi:hypothetical protein